MVNIKFFILVVNVNLWHIVVLIFSAKLQSLSNELLNNKPNTWFEKVFFHKTRVLEYNAMIVYFKSVSNPTQHTAEINMTTYDCLNWRLFKVTDVKHDYVVKNYLHKKNKFLLIINSII